MKKEDIIIFNKKRVYTGISSRSYGHTYFAQKKINPGNIVMLGFGKITDHQTPHISVQIGPNLHYKPEKWTGKYWNHSCKPNTYIKTREDGFPNLVALKIIKKDEEITYSYWMTEYKWIKQADENKVKCKCGHLGCRGKILSFSQLDNKSKEILVEKQLCSRYLMSLLIFS